MRRRQPAQFAHIAVEPVFLHGVDQRAKVGKALHPDRKAGLLEHLQRMPLCDPPSRKLLLGDMFG